MWKRIALAAGVAGLVAGLVLTAIQQSRVQPLIRAAEVIAEAGLAPERDTAPDAPRTDAERLVETGVANVILGTGFALMIAAGMTLRGKGGWLIGLGWGVAGYFVVFVAPAVGLPPELPGMESAPVMQRTVWWLLTAALGAAGIAFVVFAQRPAWRVAGLVVAAVPHLFGAPHGATQELTATHDLAGEFIAVTAWSNAIFWLLIGAMVGALYHPEKDMPPAPV